MTSRLKGLLALATAVLVSVAGVQVTTQQAAGSPAASLADPLPNRPDFRLPFACGAVIELKTYYGHSPDDKKIDMYRQGMYTGSPILASADGYVHQQFYPGGIEIRHGDGWFTTYMHMSWHVAPGTTVRPITMTSTNLCGTNPPGRQYVDTFADAPGHSSPGGTRTGTLYKGTNYVYCRVWGPEVRVGDQYNHWWLKTDLDVGPANQWVSAYYLSRWGK